MEPSFELLFLWDEETTHLKKVDSAVVHKYSLSFTYPVYTEGKEGKGLKQLNQGSDYRFELWWYYAEQKQTAKLVVREPVVLFFLFLKGTVVLELTNEMQVSGDVKSCFLIYLAAGTHHLILQEGEEYLQLVALPPLRHLFELRNEQAGLDELLMNASKKSEESFALPASVFANDVWSRLKRTEKFVQKLQVPDVAIRNYILDLVTAYIASLKKMNVVFYVPASTQEKAMALRKYIEAHFTDPEIGKLDDFGKQFHLSIKPLAKAFLLLTGKSIPQFILEERLEYAKSLLYNTHKTVLDIAIETGFTDVSHFIKKYKARYGITPGHDRN